MKAKSGYRSRKFWAASCTSALIVAVAVAATFLPSLAPMVDTVVGGLLGSLAIYCGGNVGEYVALKKFPATTQQQPPIEG